MKKFLLCSIIFFYMGMYSINAQYGFPGINAGSDVHICNLSFTSLTANIVATGGTNSYMVTSIPCIPPYPYDTGVIINNGIDDRWSTLISLPFNFCFYTNVYNKIVVGSNGVITFDITKASPSLPLTSVCPWQFTASCPSVNLPLNSIFGPYHDIDPSISGSGNIYYAILGTYPFRTFVISWNNISMFSCNTLFATHQIVLYESTNIIDVYVQNKPLCSTWNNGYAIIGIQNSTGLNGVTAPGCNTTPTWTAQNEAWRFTPNGAINYFLEWWQGSNQISSFSNITVSPSVTTSYVAKGVYLNCDYSAIEVTDTVTVYVHPNPIINVNDTSICFGDTTSLFATSNVLNTKYLWSTNDTINPLLVNPITSSIYTVIGTTLFGCKDTTTVNVIVNPNPIITTYNDTICIGNIAQVSATGGSFYLWNTHDTTSAINISPIISTTYYVSVTDTLGCTDTSSASVVINPKPIIHLTDNATICNGESIVLTASGGLTYLWNTSDITQSITVQPSSFTTYDVIVTDINGCVDTKSVDVSIINMPIPIILSNVDTICKGTIIALSVIGGDTYMWNTGDLTSTITVQPLNTTVYTVSVTNTNNNVNCSIDTSFVVNVRDCNMIYFPNAFAPNGINQIFKPISEFKSYKSYNLKIYTRWGQLIFETSNPNIGWDGKFNNENIQAGAYLYYIKYETDVAYENIGTVTVLY